MKPCVGLFLFFLAILATEAVEPNIRIYFKLPIGDGYVNLYRKFEGDIFEWQSYLDVAHAYCWTGLWQMFDLNNTLILSTSYSADLGNCDEGLGIIHQFNTGRFLGPNDTDTVAIAFYEGQPEGHYLSGEEYIIENNATTSELPFKNVPTGLVTFGHSNWTLYEGKDFTGNSTCFQSAEVVDTLQLNGSPILQVQSVKEGC